MRVGLVGNRRYRPLADLLSRLVALAPTLGVEFVYEPQLAELIEGLEPTTLEHAQLDVILSLGGDGTLLRSARIGCVRGIPVLGINLGRLGFLAGAGPDQAEDALRRLVRGQYTVERRIALTARIGDDGPRALAVNDVVIHKGGVARVIRLTVALDGEQVGTYSADGIVVATPTGSTAYSLSAGGPIVVPTMEAFVITAISPHALGVRPLVIPATATVSIRVLDPVPDPDELLVSIDGQATAHLGARQEVTIVRAAEQVLLARISDESFFARLSRKLAWGDVSGRKA
jgi:NAD+ kinase